MKYYWSSNILVNSSLPNNQIEFVRSLNFDDKTLLYLAIIRFTEPLGAVAPLKAENIDYCTVVIR